jgi:hypothetical protein
MIDAQSPVAIRALPDLCLGIVLQLGHLRLPANLVHMARSGLVACPRRLGRLGNARACASHQLSVLRFRTAACARHTQS